MHYSNGGVELIFDSIAKLYLLLPTDQLDPTYCVPTEIEHLKRIQVNRFRRW